MARDPYTVLGVPRGASDADIKKAYRRLAKANHPDTHANDKAALERFKEANSAYELLGDEAKRGQFDRGEIGPDGQPAGFQGFPGGGQNGFRAGPGGGFEFRSTGGAPFGGFGGGGGGSPEDLFAELLRGGGGAGPGFGRRGPAKGADVTYRLAVPFEEAATLKPQRVTLKSGKTLDLKLPAGFEPGRQVRLGGQGDPGAGGPGDALVTLDVGAHRFFRRDGDDVLLDLPVTLGEAVLGAKVRAPTVDGPVMVSVPAGTTSGRRLRLRGKGFTRADGTRGDQFVTLLVDLPTDDAALAAFVGDWRDDRDVRAALGI